MQLSEQYTATGDGDGPEPHITSRELARILGVSERTVARMRNDGMPSYRFAKRTRRFLASEAVLWAQQRGGVGSSATSGNVIDLMPRINPRSNTPPPAA